MEDRESIIQNYIEGYNNFDVQQMIKDFADDIVFENIQHGEVSMTLRGIDEFTNQAEKVKHFFSYRKQTILSYEHEAERTETTIDYYGILATDLPNGLRKGQEIRLAGKSIFEFRDGKIKKLADLS